MAAMNMEIRYERRVCKVDGENGLFHCWEHYSRPIEPSPMIGGHPGGVFSKVYGIVEFENGVRRVDIEHIQFCDEEHAYLCAMNKFEREKETGKNG